MVTTILQTAVNETLEGWAYAGRLNAALDCTGGAAGQRSGQRPVAGIAANNTPGACSDAAEQGTGGRLESDLTVPRPPDPILDGERHTGVDISLCLGLTHLLDVLVGIKYRSFGGTGVAGGQAPGNQPGQHRKACSETGEKNHLTIQATSGYLR